MDKFYNIYVTGYCKKKVTTEIMFSLSWIEIFNSYQVFF